MGQQTSGPGADRGGNKGGGKPRTPNPSLPEGAQRLMQMLPTVGAIVVGAGVGALEALGETGILPAWANLHRGIKAVIYAALGGFAAYQASEALDRFRRAPRDQGLEVVLCRWLEAKGALLSHAISLGGQEAIVMLHKRLTDKVEGLSTPQGGLDPAMVEALLGEDAQMALEEIIAKQDVVRRSPVAGFNYQIDQLEGFNFQLPRVG